ncbi:MAG: sodium-dependent transporter [Rikenellaceae bacterium]
MDNRGSFNSNFGAIAAAAGSAIGLGNIWRFPYVAGENGGAAFIITYLAIVLIIGVPLLMTEFSLGRMTRKNIFGTFRQLAPKTPWYMVGVIGIIASVVILSFYSVVAGWTISFLKLSLTNSFAGLSAAELSENFSSFLNSGAEPLIYLVLFVILTAIIVILGVEKGIERYNKVLMPVLFLILIILSVNSFTLDGIKEGMEFLFKPDFSKINPNVVLSALGQAFFSMSIGMGCILTYGSYMRKEDSILKTAGLVAICDVAIAILAGIAIFPAVFTFGIEPGEGPALVFITLPNIFSKMVGGYIFAVLFFVLLSVAALTSSVSLMEVTVAYLSEELKIKRTYAVILTTIVIIALGIICSLSQVSGTSLMIAGQTVLDFFDNFSSSYMLTISGFLIVIYAGWFMPKETLRAEVVANSKIAENFYSIFLFLLRIIAPIAIILVFLFKTNIIS